MSTKYPFQRLEIIATDNGHSTIFLNGIKTVELSHAVPIEWLMQHLIYHKMPDLLCRDVLMKEPVREVGGLRAKGLTLADIEELL